MNTNFGSKSIGTRLMVLAIAAVAWLPPSANAQDSAEPLFDEAVFNLLLESVTQKPAAETTPEERQNARDELTKIYLVSNLPRAQELAEAPLLKAQIELQGRALVYNAFATDFMMNYRPSDQEVFDIYEEQIALAPADEFKARHILVDTQGQAVGLIDQLKSGADFSELAKEHSTGPSAESGGDLGWFTAQGMVKPFSDAVSALEDGAYTPAPVQTQFGWHVIMREDSRESPPPPLDSVREVIVQRMAQQKFQEYIDGLSE